MGCCWSTETESSSEYQRVEVQEPDEAVYHQKKHRKRHSTQHNKRRHNKNQVQQPNEEVYQDEEQQISRSTQRNERRNIGNQVQEPDEVVYYDAENWIGHSTQHNERRHTGGQVQEPAGEVSHQEADRISHSVRYNDERRFLQLFFSVMDHLPGYQGIQRRWEKEAQQAEFNDGGRYKMSNVWGDRPGYVKSLQRVKKYVSDKKFSSADRQKLNKWAKKVVNRRTKEYNAAETKGKADPEHLIVLEAWRDVKNTLQNLL